MRRLHILLAMPAAGAAICLTAACGASGSAGAGPSPNTVSVSPPDADVTLPPGTATTGAVAAASTSATVRGRATDATPTASTPVDPGPPSVRCQPADLSLTLNVQRKAEGRLAVVVLTNSSTRRCHLTGFPGVDLVGPNDPFFGSRYELPRASATPRTVDVAPGGSAHAVIQLLVASPGTSTWTPTKVLVTPPDAAGQLIASWPSEVALQRQDAATHPATFVGPVLPGAA
jgi:hypothetical protein